MVDGNVGIDLALQGKEVYPEKPLEYLTPVLDPAIGLVLVRHRLGGEAPAVQPPQHIILRSLYLPFCWFSVRNCRI